MKKLILSLLVLSLGHTSFAYVQLGKGLDERSEAVAVNNDEGVPLFSCGVSAGGEQLMCTAGELSKAIAMLRDNFNTGAVSASSLKVRLRKVADWVFGITSGVFVVTAISEAAADARLVGLNNFLNRLTRLTGGGPRIDAAKKAAESGARSAKAAAAEAVEFHFYDALYRRLGAVLIGSGLVHALTSPHAGTPADQFSESHAASLFSQLGRKFRLETDSEILADAKSNQGLAALIIASASLLAHDM